MPTKRPSRRRVIEHFVALSTALDDQARLLLAHRGSHPDVRKLDAWAVKMSQELEKVALTYLRIFDQIDAVIDGPTTPRITPRRH